MNTIESNETLFNSFGSGFRIFICWTRAVKTGRKKKRGGERELDRNAPAMIVIYENVRFLIEQNARYTEQIHRTLNCVTSQTAAPSFSLKSVTALELWCLWFSLNTNTHCFHFTCYSDCLFARILWANSFLSKHTKTISNVTSPLATTTLYAQKDKLSSQFQLNSIESSMI